MPSRTLFTLTRWVKGCRNRRYSLPCRTAGVISGAAPQGAGLSRFDGLDFETFTVENGLPSNFIDTPVEDSEGILSVGTSTGACCLLGNRFLPG